MRHNFVKLYHHDDYGQILVVAFPRSAHCPPTVEVHVQTLSGEDRVSSLTHPDTKVGIRTCLELFESFDVNKAVKFAKTLLEN